MAEGEILIDLEGPGKPPLYPMLYAVFIRFFGPSVLGLKMFGTIFVLGAVLAVYWLANQACGRKVGALGRFTLWGFLMRPDNRWWDGELGNGYAPSLYLSYRSFP